MNIEKKIPHEVVEMVVDGDSPIRAWRKYLHMTLADAAEKMQISQSAFAQMEKSPEESEDDAPECGESIRTRLRTARSALIR